MTDPVTIRIRRQVKIDGWVARRGDVVEVPRQVAQFLVEQRRAELVERDHQPLAGYRRDANGVAPDDHDEHDPAADDAGMRPTRDRRSGLPLVAARVGRGLFGPSLRDGMRATTG